MSYEVVIWGLFGAALGERVSQECTPRRGVEQLDGFGPVQEVRHEARPDGTTRQISRLQVKTFWEGELGDEINAWLQALPDVEIIACQVWHDGGGFSEAIVWYRQRDERLSGVVDAALDGEEGESCR